MKARNWLFLASFLLMLKGAMDISIYFVQYLSLGLRYIPTAPAQMHRANVLCIIYGSYGVCLLIVGILGVIFRENPRRLRFLMTTGLILFGLGFFTGMVNYLVLLWDGHSIRDAVSSVITSVLLPAMFIHTTYIGRLEYAEDLKYEDIGDDKDRMCKRITHPCLFFVCTGSERGSVCKITLQSPGLFNTYFTKDNFRF